MDTYSAVNTQTHFIDGEETLSVTQVCESGLTRGSAIEVARTQCEFPGIENEQTFELETV